MPCKRKGLLASHMYGLLNFRESTICPDSIRRDFVGSCLQFQNQLQIWRLALWKPVSYEPIVFVCESTYKHSWRTKSGGGWLWLTAAWSIVSQSILVRPGVSGLHKTDEPSKHVIISSAAHLLSYTVEIWCISQLCLIKNTLGDNREDNHQSCSCSTWTWFTQFDCWWGRVWSRVSLTFTFHPCFWNLLALFDL